MIELKGIKKMVTVGKEKLPILEVPKLIIPEGTSTAIIGTSGSGKTTLLNILAGIIQPTEGNYFYKHNNVTKFSDKKLAEFRNASVGYIVQHFALIPEFTVYENLQMPLKYSKRKKGSYKKLIAENLQVVGLTGFEDTLIYNLSGGQKQRIAIARALMNNPDLILADEPTGALDTKTGLSIMQYLLDLQRKNGKTLIVVTHDVNIAKLCDVIIKIEDGEIINEEEQL